ncbi:hypothetical protein [Robiginitalea marina]|uniref:CHRD domain-containing protein n=1 Tax=Robiginitalea marina TaxID=2954105 RepID=A0ABT1B0E1_9FLAO|nr:hypothetical protein [Robiginitalea marina]MCO5725310.1 hypothetical protein [Robiginitalea marina]
MKINAVYLVLLWLVPLVGGIDNQGKRNIASNSEDYIKVTFNGTEFLFNEKDYLQAFTGIMPDGRHFLSINGSIPEDSSGSSEAVSILIYSQDEIRAGIYGDGGFVEFGPFGNLFVGPELGFISQTNSLLTATDPNNPQSTVNILELNETGVRATFSGTVINPMDRSSHSISNGELFVAF